MFQTTNQGILTPTLGNSETSLAPYATQTQSRPSSGFCVSPRRRNPPGFYIRVG